MRLEPSEIQELARAVASEIANKSESVQSLLGSNRIGYPEPEAAALLGIAKHVLRDARLRGEVRAKRIGKAYVYSHDALRTFLNS